jgi:hypothetical protein
MWETELGETGFKRIENLSDGKSTASRGKRSGFYIYPEKDISGKSEYVGFLRS